MLKLISKIPLDCWLWLILLCTVFFAMHNIERAAEDRTKAVYEQKLQDMNTRHQLALQFLQDANDQTVVRLTTQMRAIEETKQQTLTLIKEVPKYVTQKADASCTITAGFVQLHNAALSPAPSVTLSLGAPGDVDAATALKISTVSEIVNENYAECEARGRILALWQEWYPASRDAYLKASGMLQSNP